MTSIMKIFMNAILGESLTVSECVIFLLCIVIIFLIVIVCQLHNSNVKLYLLHSQIKKEHKKNTDGKREEGA